MTIAASCSVLRATTNISGSPTIVDGDTVQIGQTKIRLQGIDAPETDQLCLDADGKRWACGVAARDRLAEYSAGRQWECDLGDHDRYGRSLGACFIEGEDVARWMVRQGWALSYVKYSHSYDTDQIVARDARSGVWQGTFIAPWDWRHRNKQTEILGAASVPVNAQSILLGAVSAAAAPDPKCVVKGNINRKGERIFHSPGQLNYSKINMNKGLGERWFCTETEAEAAGWRKAAH
ncbi:thermonuclease family protein [Bradyrhizobium canariense]|uniref:thermonuclease family protein n=1 Tax=Bradyrhizobium canariense TaxID=255045 RepID=UPI001F0A99A6|nr:thermonuclease family protein [Bradyrhizobium canariense]